MKLLNLNCNVVCRCSFYYYVERKSGREKIFRVGQLFQTEYEFEKLEAED